MKDETFQQATQSGGESIGLLMIGKTAISLLVVIAIILACAWLLKRIGPNRRAGTQHLRVVASTPVGQRERVVIVEVADRWLVLGVGGGQVTKLDTLDPPAAPTAGATTPPVAGSFASRFGQALKHNASNSLKRRTSRGSDGDDS
ncbi:flagellar biosynthetic protein FliO [Salinicola halimionae]|uniref:flagellar biosynthetic protein FliO n=1 Tax=Salinicola halimionae TaxID=1949081 RepID=UPI000DA1A2C5|nr:flagellar biosynthetic protein FliO [Salinicola halimionae]